MKVLLVYPSQRQAITPRYKSCLQEGIGFLPPIGLLCLAGYLKKRSSHQVEVLDAVQEALSTDQVKDRVARANPQVLGISAMTHHLLDALAVASIGKQINPEMKVVLGGPHTSVFPEETLRFPTLDFVVIGEGEEPFFHLLSALERGESTLGIPGVLQAGTKFSPEFSRPFYHSQIDDLPFPDWSATDYRGYKTVVSRHPPTTIVISSRGCPCSCIFCHTAGGKKWRAQNPKRVADELEEATRLGIREFFFFDENFTFDKVRVIGICEEIRKRKLEIYFDLRSRVDTVDREMLFALKRAGCQRIQFGVESGSDRILKVLKKGITTEQAESALKLAREAGIFTYASFMLGNPGETREEILQTIRFALRLDPDFVDFSITMPLPLTELYRRGREAGIIKGDPWREFVLKPTIDFVPPFWEENFDREELETLLRQAFHSFYLRHRYVLRTLKNIRSPGEFYRKSRAAFKLVFRL